MEDMEPGKEEVESPHAFLKGSHPLLLSPPRCGSQGSGSPVAGAHRSQPWRGTGQKKTRSRHSGFTDLALLCRSQEFGRALNKLR